MIGKRSFLTLAMMAGAANLVITGCGGAGSSAAAPNDRLYLGTQAPGDVWDWSITNGTFTATNETTTFTYSGTETVLPTGFMKLNVTNTTDPNVTVGQSAYALELPGAALLIKAAGSDSQYPIVACGLGTNPTNGSTYNFVDIPQHNWSASDTAYGTLSVAGAGNNFALTTHMSTLAGVAQPVSLVNFSGSDGRLTDPTGPAGTPATMAMTSFGMFVADFGPGNGGIAGLVQPANNVDTAVIGAKSFRGFLMNAGKNQCISCAPNGDGTLHGTGYANPSGVETGTSDDGSGVTVSFTAQPNPGLVTVSIATSGGQESLVASVGIVDGKYVLLGFGNGASTVPYNVILLED